MDDSVHLLMVHPSALQWLRIPITLDFCKWEDLFSQLLITELIMCVTEISASRFIVLSSDLSNLLKRGVEIWDVNLPDRLACVLAGCLQDMSPRKGIEEGEEKL